MFRNEPEVQMIDIEECLKDVIADEDTNVVFECKIAGECQIPEDEIYATWIKDGEILRSSRRMRISIAGKWHRLEIRGITANDQGVYIILLQHFGVQSLSKGYLYVKLTKSLANVPLYLTAAPRHNFGAVRHLVHTKVPVGGIIELEARFKQQKTEDFLWFKSNRVIVEDERTIILSDERTTTLSILNAQVTDSGIYLVMYRTRFGYESTFTDVIVLDLEPAIIQRSELIPSIDEPFPRIMEAYCGAEVRMVAKVHYDSNTEFSWGRGPEPLLIRPNMEVQYFNNRYVALKIFCVAMADGGEYTLNARNRITGYTESTTCTLLINKLPIKKLTPTKILKPLDAAVACVGSSLTFKVVFEAEDACFCSAVWEVGKFRVERTNQHFDVYCNGTEFYLYIKKLEPDMAGPIVCEIRKSIPSRKSVTLCVSTANLTIVPPSVMEGLQRDGSDVEPATNGFYNVSKKVSLPINGMAIAGVPPGDIDSPVAADKGEKDFCLKIQYCKCDRDIYFLLAEAEGMPEGAMLTVEEEPQAGPSSSNANDRIILMKWPPVGDKWYSVNIDQTEDEFTGAGVSSTPSFRIKNPPLEKTLKIRVLGVAPNSDHKESTVEISEIKVEEMTDPRHVRIQKMELFSQQYRETGDTIGRGAFGQVVLIRNEGRQYYAAKTMRTILQKRRDSARREFELLKSLQHPKLVKLYMAYSTKDNFVLVMDYLWGGELFDRLVDEEYIIELDVIIYVRQICEGLQFIHSQKIAHLDMKPENIICLNPNSRLIKIADFGLARVIHERQIVRAIYGTKDYVAPEILNYEPLSVACDMWSFGVIIYLLLSGVLPFQGKNWLDYTAKINKAYYNFDDLAFRDISELAKDFVNRLIVLNPAKRMSAAEAVNHAWLQEEPPLGITYSPMRRARENLREYLRTYRERWQRAGNLMIAAHRLRRIVIEAARNHDEDQHDERQQPVQQEVEHQQAEQQQAEQQQAEQQGADQQQDEEKQEEAPELVT
ncbi:unnamed protein product [Colias eurytheme]|nr:unnamed protein product [Colias eurytheme]